ncbi:SIR2 family protein [Arthrobacter sp. RAF14]|uniref:SIR2 family protein n=1 Tax=Arthrobacter sp. RAF14 TaxID=3233051 RepID=UPI003F904048
MTGKTQPAERAKTIALYKGSSNVLKSGLSDPEVEPLARARKDVADAMNSKHLSFLFGSGCSSAWGPGGELGIPTMAPLAKTFLNKNPFDGKVHVPSAVRDELRGTLGLDLDHPDFANNLERLMEVLYGFRFALQQTSKDELGDGLGTVEGLIEAVKRFVRDACLAGQTKDPEQTVVHTYQKFYRRVSQRDRALPRPWVFTTNYDLFNEIAMDRLGVPYINGFQGAIERRFNPATFRYTIAEQLDISTRKWSSVDSLVYFVKLHGSLSWRSTDDGLFPVQENVPGTSDEDLDQLLIYPTPAKQNASFAAPYSDMFRELQSRVAREQSALITVGYSFGDEHVNNIIFQALTIPTFRLVAFVDPNANAMVQKLRELDDPRIWIIGTEEKKADWKGHYFNNFVEEFMPSSGDDPTEGAIEKVLSTLIKPARTAGAVDEQ